MNNFSRTGTDGSQKIRSALLERDVQLRSDLKRLARTAPPSPPRNDLLPRLTLTERSLTELKTPSRNIRKRDEAHIKEVANSIATFGFNVPVLIDDQDVLLDGVIRMEAAKLCGLTRVPCIVASSLTPAERKLLRMTINRLGEKGAWEFDELKIELEQLIVEEAPIEVSGFELFEIDGILADAKPPGIEPGPVEPKAGAPISQIGDVYRLGPHRLICGDATDPDVMRRLMEGDAARIVLTDQPYNVPIAGHVSGGAHREFAMASGEMTDEEFLAFNQRWIAVAEASLVDGGLFATFIDWRHLSSVAKAANEVGLIQINLIVWSKTNAGMGSLYRSQHELLPVFKKGQAPHLNNIDLGRKGRWRSNLWTYAGASTMGSDARKGLQHHPTVKPVTMLVDALYDVTNRGDIVLDPFLGSGSTLIAAEQAGRICRGIEIDPLYVDLILRRYEEVTGCESILDETGEPFEAVERRRTAEVDPAACSSQTGSAEDVEPPNSRPLKPVCRRSRQ